MRWTQVFLDDCNVHAGLRVDNAVSSRFRVFEVDAVDYDETNRAAWHDGDVVFYISDEIHQWLYGQKSNYAKEVTLDPAMQTENTMIPGVPQVFGFILSFLDPELAMMFKLAWGGE